MRHPQPFDPDVYQGYYHDPHEVPEEPFVGYIHELAANGLTKTGHHGPVSAMGVSRGAAPDAGTPSSSSPRSWPACRCSTTSRSAPRCASARTPTKPLWLDIPIFVSDMSFGALSQEAKTALARGAELAGTGDLLGRGRHAARGAGRGEPLLLRAGVGPVRLVVGRAGQGAGLPLQGRPGRQDRHRRPPARRQGQGSHRRGARPARGHAGRLAGDLPRLAHDRRLPPLRRRGARAVGRHPDRVQAVGPAHRGRHRRRARGRRRLRDPRRPRRRHRRRAPRVPRPHLGADHPRAGPGPGRTSTGSAGATSAS